MYICNSSSMRVAVLPPPRLAPQHGNTYMINSRGNPGLIPACVAPTYAHSQPSINMCYIGDYKMNRLDAHPGGVVNIKY